MSIAPTKKLCKIAHEIAYHHPEHRDVITLARLSKHELDRLLAAVEDVWGIGPRYAQRLRLQGIHTAQDLKYVELGMGSPAPVRGGSQNDAGIARADLFSPGSSSQTEKRDHECQNLWQTHWQPGPVGTLLWTQGLAREWQMRRPMLSPRAVTSWEEIMVVHAD